MDDLADYAASNVALRMLLQLDPSGIGSAIDVYLSDVHEKHKKKKLHEFFERINSGKLLLTEELIKSDDFLFAFVATTNAVINSNKKEKIKLFANLLIHGIKTQECASLKYEQYLSITEEVTSLELAIVESLFSLEAKFVNQENSEKKGTKLQVANDIWEEFVRLVEEKYGVKSELLSGVLTRINRTGLYETITGTFWDYSGDRGSTTELYSDYRKWVIEQET